MTNAIETAWILVDKYDIDFKDYEFGKPPSIKMNAQHCFATEEEALAAASERGALFIAKIQFVVLEARAIQRESIL